MRRRQTSVTIDDFKGNTRAQSSAEQSFRSTRSKGQIFKEVVASADSVLRYDSKKRKPEFRRAAHLTISLT